MDTVEAPVVAIVDHEMFVYYDGKRLPNLGDSEVAVPGSR
jgi:hypothetical protein